MHIGNHSLKLLYMIISFRAFLFSIVLIFTFFDLLWLFFLNSEHFRVASDILTKGWMPGLGEFFLNALGFSLDLKIISEWFYVHIWESNQAIGFVTLSQNVQYYMNHSWYLVGFIMIFCDAFESFAFLCDTYNYRLSALNWGKLRNFSSQVI